MLQFIQPMNMYKPVHIDTCGGVRVDWGWGGGELSPTAILCQSLANLIFSPQRN